MDEQINTEQPSPKFNKKTLVIGVAISLFVFIAGGIFATLYTDLWNPGWDPFVENAKEQGEVVDIYLKADKGLNIEYVAMQSLGVDIVNADPGSIGERVIFERYRFYDTQTDDEIDIRPDNVKAFVTEPGSIEKEITTGNIFYLMHVYPFATAGEYVFRLKMPDGQEYRTTLDFLEPQIAELVLDEAEAQDSLDTAGIFLRPFSPENIWAMSESGVPAPENIEGIDMTTVNLVYHVLSSNAVTYISPNAAGRFLADADSLKKEHHVFLLKQGGTWYFATHINSEE